MQNQKAFLGPQISRRGKPWGWRMPAFWNERRASRSPAVPIASLREAPGARGAGRQLAGAALGAAVGRAVPEPRREARNAREAAWFWGQVAVTRKE